METGAGVVKRPVAPLDRIVAGLTRRRKTRGRVIHRGNRIRIVILVARNARSARQVVVVVYVAIAALPWGNCMGTGERESCTTVIERCIQPRRCVVALFARLGEVGRNVIGSGCALVIRQVAEDAGIRRDVVAAVFLVVTVGTLPRRHRMHSCQGKVRIVVIKRSVRPRSSVVALLAGLRKTG